MTDRRTMFAATAAGVGLAMLGTAEIAKANGDRDDDRDRDRDNGSRGAQSALDWLAIINRISAYGYDYDAGRVPAWALSMFTEDIKITKMLAGVVAGTIEGRANVIAAMGPTSLAWQAAGIQRRHNIQSIEILELAARKAKARAYMIITSTNSPQLVTTLATCGMYQFDLVKQRGNWLVSAYVLGLDGFPGTPPGVTPNPSDVFDA